MKTLLLSFIAALTLASLPLHGQALDAEQYFGDLAPAGDGWYYDDVFGYIYPLEQPWVYVYSLGKPIAIVGTDAQLDRHYTYDSFFGWGYISLDTSPWMYLYDTDGTVGDLDSVAEGWYYSYGLSTGGAAPNAYYASSLATTVNSALTVEVVNGTDEAVSAANAVPDANIYVTLYSGKTGTFTPAAVGLNQSMTFNSQKKKNAFTFQTTDWESGRMFISYDNKAASGGGYTPNTGKMPDSQSKIDSFSKTLPRNDKIEITYQFKGGVPTGACNLTAVDYFGVPLQLETLDAAGNVLQSFTFFDNTTTVTNDVTAINSNVASKALIKDANGNFLRVLAPVEWSSPNSSSPDYEGNNPYPSMSAYVASVNGTTVTIEGYYNGVAGQYPPASYSYSGQISSTGPTTLTGTLSTDGGAPSAGQNVVIQAADLISGIYTANPPYTKGGAAGAIGDNDVYSAIMRDLLSGFNGGYIGGTYGSLPSDQWWDKPPFVAQGNNQYYNQYAKAIQDDSQAYGFPFSDRLRSQLAYFNQDTATLRITILPDDLLNAPHVTVSDITDTSVKLDWSAVPNATGYTLEYYPPLTGTTASLGNVTTKTVTGLTPGTPYTFYLRATANSGAVMSQDFPVQATTTGTRPLVKGTAQWQASFTFYKPLIQTGDTVTINGLTATIDPSTTNLTFQNGTIQNYTKVSGGNYPSLQPGPGPAVTVTGDGFGAAAVSTVSGTHSVDFVNPSKIGFGYTNATVSIPGGSPDANYTAQITTTPQMTLPVSCKLNQQNAYVLTWKRANGDIVFETMLYADVAGLAPGGNAMMDLATVKPGSTATFLEGNTYPPMIGQSGGNDPWVVFLLVKPDFVK